MGGNRLIGRCLPCFPAQPSKLTYTAEERRTRNAQSLSRLGGVRFAAPPAFHDTVKLLRHRDSRPAKANAAGFCRCNALRLPLADALTFCLRNETQELKHHVRNELANQLGVFFL